MAAAARPPATRACRRLAPGAGRRREFGVQKVREEERADDIRCQRELQTLGILLASGGQDARVNVQVL